MARGNSKDPSFTVVRLRSGNDRLDRSFKSQNFPARSDARDFARDKNALRRDTRKRYAVIPTYPGPTNRSK